MVDPEITVSELYFFFISRSQNLMVSFGYLCRARMPHSRRALLKTHKAPCGKCFVVSILIFVVRFNSYVYL